MEKKHKILLVIILCATLLSIIFLPIQVPYNINGAAKLLPVQQWILSRGSNGEIFTNTINNLSGINNTYQLTSFERGESMILDLNQEIKNGSFINNGDTVGVIYSSKQQESLIELTGELQVLTASLEVSLSGLKSTQIKESQERLELAKSEYGKQNKIVERLYKLFKKNLIAEENYQTASDELLVLEKAINVREAELQSSISGQKVEEINLLKQQISAVENKIDFLNREIDSQNYIVTPFNGRIERSFAQDTVLTVSNYELGVAIIPVSIEEAIYLNEGEKVKFMSTNSNNILNGVIQAKQSVMQMIGGKQCVLVLATVYNISNDFISGIITQSEINCGKVPLLTYLERNIVN